MPEMACWVVAELSDHGDGDRVLERLLEHHRQTEGQVRDETVVVTGNHAAFRNVQPALESVADHLDRVLFVASQEGGMGATMSRYFEVQPGEAFSDPDEEIPGDSPGRRWVEEHFDYYATKYGIDAAV